jgi:hypothetical protein
MRYGQLAWRRHRCLTFTDTFRVGSKRIDKQPPNPCTLAAAGAPISPVGALPFGVARESWRTLFAVFPDFSSEVLEVREPRRDYLIVSIRVRGHGVEGGAPFEEVWWQAIKARDGKATWWQNFGTAAEALEAAS